MLRDGVDGISINMGDSISSTVNGEVECTTGGTYIMCRANNTVATDQESYSVTILSKSHRFLFSFLTESVQYTIPSYND